MIESKMYDMKPRVGQPHFLCILVSASLDVTACINTGTRTFIGPLGYRMKAL